MKRRDFLKGVAGVATVAVAAQASAKVAKLPTIPKADLLNPTNTGFGLAPVKAEGSSVAYDRAGLITKGNHPIDLWPGIEEWFKKGYGSEFG
jgi:hypothetical protein